MLGCAKGAVDAGTRYLEHVCARERILAVHDRIDPFLGSRKLIEADTVLRVNVHAVIALIHSWAAESSSKPTPCSVSMYTRMVGDFFEPTTSTVTISTPRSAASGAKASSSCCSLRVSNLFGSFLWHTNKRSGFTPTSFTIRTYPQHAHEALRAFRPIKHAIYTTRFPRFQT